MQVHRQLIWAGPFCTKCSACAATLSRSIRRLRNRLPGLRRQEALIWWVTRRLRWSSSWTPNHPPKPQRILIMCVWLSSSEWNLFCSLSKGVEVQVTVTAAKVVKVRLTSNWGKIVSNYPMNTQVRFALAQIMKWLSRQLILYSVKSVMKKTKNIRMILMRMMREMTQQISSKITFDFNFSINDLRF